MIIAGAFILGVMIGCLFCLLVGYLSVRALRAGFIANDDHKREDE